MGEACKLDRPPWGARLFRELEGLDDRAITLGKGLTAPQLNWRSHPGEWSVGQCLEHLTLANQTYARAMARALDGRPMKPVMDLRIGWFGRWFIRTYIEPSKQTKQARAPRQIEPPPDVEASILGRFLESNQKTRELLLKAGGYDVNRIRFENPYVGFIRFTVGTGFEILCKHESRHLLQAEQIRNSPGFPAA